jgi:hypothetical protein
MDFPSHFARCVVCLLLRWNLIQANEEKSAQILEKCNE